MDIIIGAGISGLSYANFCRHDDYLVIEKENEPGGYCRTVKQDGFIWDYSGHFFHFKDQAIKEYLISRISGRILDVKKSTKIKYKENLIDFPFQKNIHQLPHDEFIECLHDLIINEEVEEKSFLDMIYNKFGKSIAEKFLIPYNEKLYACNLDSLDKDAMGRFFPKANFKEIIKNFKGNTDESYNSIFTYPEMGAFEYIKALLEGVNINKIKLNEEVVSINLGDKTVITNKSIYKFDRLISSMPLVMLMDKSATDYDSSFYTWNKVLVFNLGFDRKGNNLDDHWVYFPERDYCFYRIGYYDNIMQSDRLSLYVELGFPPNSKIEVDTYLQIVLKDLTKAGIIDTHKLVSYHHIIMNPAYVHINKLSQEDKILKKRKFSENSIYSIGRYGDWKYCSIEDNIIEAKQLAELLN